MNYEVGTRGTCRAEWMGSSAMGRIRAGRTETQLSGRVGTDPFRLWAQPHVD